MKRIITSLALLAALGSSITAAGPAFAQIDCNDPRLAMMYCRNQPPGAQLGGNNGGQHRGDNNQNRPPRQNPPPSNNDGRQFRNDNSGRQFHNDYNGPRYDNNGPSYRAPDYGNRPYRGGPDRNRFFREFRQFNFAPFPFPDFTVSPGYRVPRYYDLRPVPPSLWIYYPAYRGYLFFETRDGQIVIVNPRTYRIVAIF